MLLMFLCFAGAYLVRSRTVAIENGFDPEDLRLSSSGTDDDTSDGNATSPLCTILCCVFVLVLIAAGIALIVFIIMGSGKMKKRSNAIETQAAGAKGAAPAQPMGAPQQVQMQPGTPQPAAGGPMTWAQQIFVGDSFRVDKKILHLGFSYYIYDAWNRPIAYSFMKPLRLKEDIRIYTDDTKSYEIMSIQQEQIIQFSGTFQVWDTMSKQFLGILKRQGFKSMIQDEWSILNYNRQEVGHIKEDSTGMAIARRFVPYGGWIPNASFINYQGRDIGVIKEKIRVIGNEYYIHLVPGTQNVLDRRLALACVLLMAMFETRKNR
jgi:hypothetical protein